MCTHLYSQAWDSVFVLGYQNIAICVFQQVPMVRENMPNLTCTNVYNKYTCHTSVEFCNLIGQMQMLDFT